MYKGYALQEELCSKILFYRQRECTLYIYFYIHMYIHVYIHTCIYICVCIYIHIKPRVNC